MKKTTIHFLLQFSILIKKRLFIKVFLALLCFSCSQSAKNAMQLSGNVKGLKKGVLYLEKRGVESPIIVDSFVVEGDSRFKFEYPLEYPELFYLKMKKSNGDSLNRHISFFGEKGPIEIRTTLENYELAAKINGSKSQKKYEEYQKIKKRYNDKHLDLIKALFDTRLQSGNSDSVNQILKKNQVSSSLYTVNFAFSNTSSYVTPYVLLTESENVNPAYLDSIYSILDKNVAASPYGKILQERLTTKN